VVDRLITQPPLWVMALRSCVSGVDVPFRGWQRFEQLVVEETTGAAFANANMKRRAGCLELRHETRCEALRSGHRKRELNLFSGQEAVCRDYTLVIDRG
jgi:hypothetical protein